MYSAIETLKRLHPPLLKIGRYAVMSKLYTKDSKALVVLLEGYPND
jgi:hypothetical protein